MFFFPAHSFQLLSNCQRAFTHSNSHKKNRPRQSYLQYMDSQKNPQKSPTVGHSWTSSVSACIWTKNLFLANDSIRNHRSSTQERVRLSQQQCVCCMRCFLSLYITTTCQHDSEESSHQHPHSQSTCGSPQHHKASPFLHSFLHKRVAKLSYTSSLLSSAPDCPSSADPPVTADHVHFAHWTGDNQDILATRSLLNPVTLLRINSELPSSSGCVSINAAVNKTVSLSSAAEKKKGKQEPLDLSF